MYATPRSIGFPRADKWGPNSGTSLATPLFAGVVALAGQLAGRPLGMINPLLYQLAAQHDPGIVDVQGQGNTFRAGHVTVRGFPAGPGYDLVTGLGTIDAAKFVTDLVRLARQEAQLMTARSARLALAGGCAAVLVLAACSNGPSTNVLTPAAPGSPSSPAAGPSTPAAGSSGAVIPGEPGAPPKIGGLSPAQFVAAYDTGPLYSQGITGKGQTIVIVDPFGSPTIEQDLAAYDKAWHLPAPPSFRVIAPAGPVPPFRPTGARTGAAVETTLDVESAHLLAPGAGILLVETPTAETEGTAGFPEIVRPRST